MQAPLPTLLPRSLASTSSFRKFCQNRRPQRLRNSSAPENVSQWWAMVSMMLRRWSLPTWESQLEPEPMWRSRPETVLVRSDPRDVPRIIDLSKASYRKMIQNLAWATSYNVVAIPLAAGVLARWGIILSPAIGAVLMSISTIIVAINAQLLRRTRLE